MKIMRGSLFALMPLVAVAVVVLPGTTSATGSLWRSGFLRVTKECLQYTGQAGSFCTITSSNVPEIKVGSKVFYGQAADVPPGLLDS
ncbi:MAG TPA: hypothetical protein VIH21_02130, partial [Dehalococcoidia bacterium]